MEYLKQKRIPFLVKGVRDLNLNYRISSSMELNFDLPNLSMLDKLSRDSFLCNFVTFITKLQYMYTVCPKKAYCTVTH